MSYCKNCGAPIAPGAKFCKGCGARVRPETVPSFGGFCKSCGAALLTTDRFCKACGTPAQIREQPAPEQKPAEPAAPASEEKHSNRCRKCGAVLLSFHKFCPICGESVAAPTRKCAFCGAELMENHKFCPICGSAAAADAPATPVKADIAPKALDPINAATADLLFTEPTPSVPATPVKADIAPKAPDPINAATVDLSFAESTTAVPTTAVPAPPVPTTAVPAPSVPAPVEPAPVTPTESAPKLNTPLTPVCANCGAALKPGVKFCTHCGNPIKLPSAAPLTGEEPTIASFREDGLPASRVDSPDIPAVRVPEKPAAPVAAPASVIEPAAPVMNVPTRPVGQAAPAVSAPEPPRINVPLTPVCANCGAALKPGVKFCTHCGNPIKLPSAAPLTGEEPTIASFYEEGLPSSRVDSPDIPAVRVPETPAAPAAAPASVIEPAAPVMNVPTRPVGQAAPAVSAPEPPRINVPLTPVCANCGAALKPGVKFCTRCGNPVKLPACAPLTGEEETVASYVTSESPTVAVIDNPDAAAPIPEMSAPAIVPPAPAVSMPAAEPEKPAEKPADVSEAPKINVPLQPVCAKCGAALKPGVRFCTRCGNPVELPVHTPLTGDEETIASYPSDEPSAAPAPNAPSEPVSENSVPAEPVINDNASPSAEPAVPVEPIGPVEAAPVSEPAPVSEHVPQDAGSAAEVKVCPGCGAELKPGRNFCPKCGQYVFAPVKAPEPMPSFTPIPEPEPVREPAFTPIPVPAPKPEAPVPTALGGYSICSGCGAVIEPGKKFCKKCGAPVTMPDLDDMPTIALSPEFGEPSVKIPPMAPAPVQPAAPAAPVQADPVPVPTAEDFDICAYCGAAVPAGTKVCTRCGRDMLPLPPVQRVAPAKAYCRSCGCELIPGKKFCTRCGKPTGV